MHLEGERTLSFQTVRQRDEPKRFQSQHLHYFVKIKGVQRCVCGQIFRLCFAFSLSLCDNEKLCEVALILAACEPYKLFVLQFCLAQEVLLLLCVKRGRVCSLKSLVKNNRIDWRSEKEWKKNGAYQNYIIYVF